MASKHIDRRTMLTRGAAVAGSAAVGTALAADPATAATTPGIGTRTAAGTGATIGPDDPRYDLLTNGINQRFIAQPDHIKMIRSTKDAEDSVRAAYRAGKRISVRSGGHCLADFTCNPEVEIILDFSEMTGVDYDPRFRAFVVESGARLYNVFEELYKGWAVTLPGGVCHSVGVGGHVSGGGYGLLSRAYGLVVDHLYAVEVVVVDTRGKVRTVIATREKDDPNRDLWWAHTGGGGGNFGLATRYWFRSPEATGTVPGDQLVSPPTTMLTSAIDIRWEDLTEAGFTRLMKNFGAWHEANSAPDSVYRHLSSLFNVNTRAHGRLSLYTQIDGDIPGADKLLDDYLKAITAGIGARPTAMTKPSGELAAMPNLIEPTRMHWLKAARMVGAPDPVGANPEARVGLKSAYFKKNFTDHQVAELYRYFSDPDFGSPDTTMVLLSFGGTINSIAEPDTASAQRSSVFKVLFQTIWSEPEQDDYYMAWIRSLYEDVFAETKGVPEIGDVTDGCYINYPDMDMADDRFNRSGIPWHFLFYKDNYARLRKVKSRWDPSDFFRHSMSVKPAR
ncbi:MULTISPECIES: FAD-binding protein [unclassified Streptomyces]|uniref:FAD-binding oxidoreductase n=1 Tax=unclassified Streptomyces TaxID=2593676 RepID=UPI00081E61C0|nr:MULTISPECIES: FAD-binding protein [unclassified Streptomyces]MYZ35141.1 FAD-binding protein [Streptomyces sp. SID4917]SCF73028.1 Berberine and berberine like [Streptomyces sp. MnatMP-M17]